MHLPQAVALCTCGRDTALKDHRSDCVGIFCVSDGNPVYLHACVALRETILLASLLNSPDDVKCLADRTFIGGSPSIASSSEGHPHV